MNRYTQFASFEGLETRKLMSDSPLGGDNHIEPRPTPGTTELKEDALHHPTRLAATRIGQAVTLTWKDNSNNETGFALFSMKLQNGKPVFTQLGTVDANVTTFSYTAELGISKVMVRAYTDAGRSNGSNVIDLKVCPVIPVTAPNKLRSEAKSSTSILIKWEGDKGAKGGYIIERSADGQSGWTAVGTSAKDKRCFTDKGLTAGTFYYYRITAIGEDGGKATSAVLTGKTKISDHPEPKKTTTTVRK